MAEARRIPWPGRLLCRLTLPGNAPTTKATPHRSNPPAPAPAPAPAPGPVPAPPRPRRPGVYVFGAPKAGDREFAQAYDSVLGNLTLRFVTRDAPLDEEHANHKYDDLVTLLPPSPTEDGYTHVGRYWALWRQEAPSSSGGSSNNSSAAAGNGTACVGELGEEEQGLSVLGAVLAAASGDVADRHESDRYAAELSSAILEPPPPPFSPAAAMLEKDRCVFRASIGSKPPAKATEPSW